MFPSQDDMEPNQKDQKYGAHIVDHHVQIAESMYHPGSDERQGIVYDNPHCRDSSLIRLMFSSSLVFRANTMNNLPGIRPVRANSSERLIWESNTKKSFEFLLA
jgi:hypothetical protein